ncbi:hypothetical protein [Geomicrobium sp. JCM 19039]|uniref:hypothetical protein n=1 Tax=Geomicrobium sp. JCM 19039 TaxID=1460636 RepID=UPI00045F4668|nr:hypothetical protein [Geomicrobium sp. JCM 19039]GAK11361.1 hypothetical protein JCM19039_1051 [Geomicrobium sp. JCM 19039]
MKRIDKFKIICFACNTEVIVSVKDARSLIDESFNCPVCKENLSSDVHKTVRSVHKINQELEDLNELENEGFISLRV